MSKQNCWEVLKCGRGPGGTRVAEFGVCPVAKDFSADGTNEGVCAGRVCWAVSGTFCNGEVQGDFAQKKLSCMSCKFFNKVREEEDKEFRLLKPGQEYEPDKKPIAESSTVKKED